MAGPKSPTRSTNELVAATSPVSRPAREEPRRSVGSARCISRKSVDDDRDRDHHHVRALRELRDRGDTSTIPVTTAPTPFRVAAPAPAGAPRSEPAPDHPGLRQRERGEDADHVELDQVRERWRRRARPGRARAPARTTTPFENTRRSPRLRNWLGMNWSRARIDDRRGKSWNAVFAARTRIPAVKTCSDDEPRARRRRSRRRSATAPDRECATSSVIRTCEELATAP